MDEFQELKKWLSNHYSKSIPVDRLQNLLNVQKQLIVKGRKNRLLLVPIVVSFCMGVILVNNIYRFDDRIVSDPDSIDYLSEYMSEGTQIDFELENAQPSKVTSNVFALSAGSASHFGTEPYRLNFTPRLLQEISLQEVNTNFLSPVKPQSKNINFRKFGDTVLNFNKFDNTEISQYLEQNGTKNNWEVSLINVHEIDNGATAKHYHAINRHNGHAFKLVIFENLPEAKKIMHPFHVFRNGLNIRIWKDNERIITIAGNSFDEEELGEMIKYID